ncbi:hypothetical protein IMY05_C4653000200 [Salix suchowensis]|nr:hypothetical protein IMY05_C4653000200 [Salix suchowensis]
MVFGSKSRRSSLFTKSRARSRNTSSSSQRKVQQNTEWVSSDDEVPATQGSASGSRDALVKTLKGWKSTRAGLLGKGVVVSNMQTPQFVKKPRKAHACHCYQDQDKGDDQGSEPLLQLPEDNNRVPDRLKLLVLKQQGLALVDRENGISFQTDESWIAVDRRLRGYFPAVWEHFDDLEYSPEANCSNEFQSRWLVCMRVQRGNKGCHTSKSYPAMDPWSRSQTKIKTALNTVAASSSTIPSETVASSLKRKASAISVSSDSSTVNQEPGLLETITYLFGNVARSAGIVTSSTSTVAVAAVVDAEAELATDLGSDDNDDMADATWHSNPTQPVARSPLLLAEMSSFTIDDSIPNPWVRQRLTLDSSDGNELYQRSTLYKLKYTYYSSITSLCLGDTSHLLNLLTFAQHARVSVLRSKSGDPEAVFLEGLLRVTTQLFNAIQSGVP